MTALVGFYRAQLRNSLALQFQYRAAMVIWMLGLVLEPVIYLAVWASVAQAQGGAVSGFTLGDFAAYYIVLLVVQHITQIWHMWEYDYIIRQGVMSGRLLRPLHPIHRDAAENIAFKVLMLLVVVPSVIVLVLLFQPTFATPLWAALAFIPILLLAAVLAFMLGWAVALAAFWTTRTFAINQTYFVAMFFFSGQIAPLALLPDFFQAIANVLPFRWFVSFPTEVFLGRVSPQDALGGVIVQVLWIAGSALLIRVTWRAGLARYTAMGG